MRLAQTSIKSSEVPIPIRSTPRSLELQCANGNPFPIHTTSKEAYPSFRLCIVTLTHLRRSGVLVFHGTTDYGAAAMRNDIDCGADVHQGNDPRVRSRFPEDAAVLSNLEQAYFNPTGGWANATAAMTHMIELAKELGAQFLTGHTLDDLVFESEYGKKGQRVVGVKTANGKVLDADIVVLAMGAWTASSLCARPDLGIADRVVASG
jgi:glycine/D-amino acid oxidase-like deaminating enzyme